MISSNDDLTNTEADDSAFEDALFKSEEEFEDALYPTKKPEEVKQAEPEQTSKPQPPREREDAYDHFLTKASKTFALDSIKHTPPKRRARIEPLPETTDQTTNRRSSKDKSFLTKEISLKDILTTEIKVDGGLKKSKDLLTKEINVDKILTAEISLSKSKRSLPLDFDLPPINPKIKVSTLPQANQIDALFSKKGTKLSTIFEKAASDLSILSEIDAPIKDRIKVLDSYSTPLIPAIKSFIASYEKNPAIPDDPQRVPVLKHCESSLSNLITGYKQVYQHFYSSPGGTYNSQRDTANSSAFRLIELISMQQQLMAAIYRRVPKDSIKSLNKVFTALTQCEPGFIAEQQSSLVTGNKISIWELFLQIQLCLAFDFMSFSATQHSLLIAYFRHHINTLKILSADDFNESNDIVKWMIPHNHDSAPISTNTVDKTQLPGIFIVIDNLLNQINDDYYECLTLQNKKKPVHSSRLLKKYPLTQILALLGTLSSLTKRAANGEPLHQPTSYKSINLTFHSGFKRCVLTCQQKRRERLAGISPENSTNGIEKKDLPWRIGAEEEKHLFIQTTENSSTVKLDIGWLVLITLNTKKGEKTILSRIVRIERGEYNQVNIILEKLGSTVVDVIYPSLPGSTDKKDQLLLGLLTTSKNNSYFICPNNNPFWGGRKFKVRMPNRTLAPLKIDLLKTATNSFQIYKLI